MLFRWRPEEMSDESCEETIKSSTRVSVNDEFKQALPDTSFKKDVLRRKPLILKAGEQMVEDFSNSSFHKRKICALNSGDKRDSKKVRMKKISWIINSIFS